MQDSSDVHTLVLWHNSFEYNDGKYILKTRQNFKNYSVMHTLGFTAVPIASGFLKLVMPSDLPPQMHHTL